MKKVFSLALVLGLLLCLCSCASSSDKKFVGTWKCDSWKDFWGNEHKNAEIVLKADKSGRIQDDEDYVTIPLTWEKLDENTIMIYSEDSNGQTTGDEYSYEVIDGTPHLKFDNGKVTKDFYKQ